MNVVVREGKVEFTRVDIPKLRGDSDRALASVKGRWGPATRRFRSKYFDYACWYRGETIGALSLPLPGVDEERSIVIQQLTDRSDLCEPY